MCRSDNISTTKDFIGAEEHFHDNINNIDGLTVMGHSVATPLVAIIPIILFHKERFNAELYGGTETPGAPFVDAILDGYISIIRATGINIDIEIHSRGCIGIGGGRVLLRNRCDTKLKPFIQLKEDFPSAPSITARVYVFGDSHYIKEARSNITKHLIVLESKLNRKLFIEYINIPYERNMFQILFLIMSGQIIRDVPVVYEELENDKYSSAMDLAYKRLVYELEHAHLFSRFHVDQVLPLLAMIKGESILITDTITQHTDCIIQTVKSISNRSITVTKLNKNAIELKVI